MVNLGAQHENLDQKVYQIIKQMIEDRTLLPGQKIPQEKLAGELAGNAPLAMREILRSVVIGSELPIEQVSAALTLMELKGMVKKHGNGRYVRA